MNSKIKIIISLTVLVIFFENCSAPSNDISEIIDTEPPVAGVLSFSNVGETSVNISWTAFIDENGINKVLLLRDNVEILTTLNTNASGFLDTELLPETTYSYVAKAFDNAGNFSISNEIIITTDKVNNRVLVEDLNLPDGVIDDSFINWDASTGVLEFTKDIVFSTGKNQTEIDDDNVSFYYDIPNQVKEIVIKENVTIIGHFRFNNNVVIRGESRTTSIILGTPTRGWALGVNKKNDSPNCNEATGDDRAADCQKWKFGAISGNQNGVTVTIRDLTIRNARTYAITSFNSKIIMDNVFVHNTRQADDGGGGDFNSNSDGISAGKGSIVRNCKFDTWDDSIKLYKDMTVENVTIVQNSNGAAFQLGWSSKPNTKHVLNNILIETNNQNYSNLSVFAISGENANLNTVIDLGNFFVDIKPSQTFRNTGKILPLFLNKSTGNVNITLNQTASNYFIKAPKGYAEYDNQGGNPNGNFNITGSICNNSINAGNLMIDCGTSSAITGCGW